MSATDRLSDPLRARLTALLGEACGCVIFCLLAFVLWVLDYPKLLNAEDYGDGEGAQCSGWGHPFAGLFYRRQYDWEIELYGRADDDA